MKRMKQGDAIECQVARYDRRGVAQGDYDGWQVEVPGAFVGERVRARVAHVGVQSRKLYIHPPELLKEHPQRRAAPCRQQARCSGCPWMPLTETTQAAHKKAWLAESHGLTVESVVQLDEGAAGYRWSSKRVVGSGVGGLLFGSYRRGSHDLADMRGCLVDHPDIRMCMDELRTHCNAMGITPYNETTRRGELRFVLAKTNGRGEVLLTLVCADNIGDMAQLAEGLNAPSGVFRCVQSGKGNTMRGAELEHLAGADHLVAQFGGVIVTLGPLSFMQPNPLMAEQCYSVLLDGLSGTVAYDLYAGLGVTTRLLARNFEKVVACDNHIEGAQREWIEEVTTEALLDLALASERPPPDVVVCNPPRGGLGERVCQQLNELCARRPFQLRIMSCDAASLVRDSRRLEAFEHTATRAFDTMPQTAHVELVAQFAPRHVDAQKALD